MRALGLIALLAVLAACTPTTQTVQLAPEPPELSGPQGRQALALDVVDKRDDDSLGRLERLGDDSGIIRAATDTAYTVKLTAAESLRRKGFRPGLWSEDAQPRLLIEIETLKLEVAATVPRTVTGRAVFHASAWQDGRRFTGRAESEISERIALAPSAETTAGFIDDLISRTLEELLDGRLVGFLAGGEDGDGDGGDGDTSGARTSPIETD